MTGQIIIIVIMLLLSAFFSASETALTSVSRIKLKYKAEQGSPNSKNAKTVLALIETYDKTLSTLLIGNNIVNIALTSVATVMTLKLMTPEMAEHYGVVAATLATAAVVLVFGEILPKTIARIRAESFCMAIGGVLRLLVIIFTPVSAFFLLIQGAAGKLFSQDEKTVSVTEQELIHIIEEIEDEGVLEEQESSLVQSALTFDETTAGQILTPRVHIVAVSVNEDIKKVCELFMEEGYSRIPVYEKTVDHICGTLYNKDFMRSFVSGQGFSIRDIMQEVLRIPALMKISEVLKLMQRERHHLAIVVDQYGGTEGLVTLEDVLEELVGEIFDEGDEIHSPIVFTADNIFEVSGELPLGDFNRYMKKRELNYSINSDSNTVGGWVFELFGKIPDENETTETEDFKITVLSREKRGIKKLKFEIIQ